MPILAVAPRRIRRGAAVLFFPGAVAVCAPRAALLSLLLPCITMKNSGPPRRNTGNQISAELSPFQRPHISPFSVLSVFVLAAAATAATRRTMKDRTTARSSSAAKVPAHL